MQKKYPVIYKSSNIYENDLLSLADAVWISGEIINLYYLLLQEQFQDIQSVKLIDPSMVNFLLFENQQQQLLKLSKLKLFESQYLFFPFNSYSNKSDNGNHWTLIVYDVKQSIFNIYDSFWKIPQGTATFRKVIQNLKKVLCGSRQQIKIKLNKKIPLQNNSYDCGIYLLKYTEAILQSLRQTNNVIQQHEIIKSFNNVNFKENLRVPVRQKLRQLLQRLKVDFDIIKIIQ